MLKNTLTAYLICCTLIGFAQLNTYELAIQNVQIFNSQTKTTTSNKTILINADTIAAIIAANQPFQADSTIEGNNRLVTPGFIDTHVHLDNTFAYANGYSPATIKQEAVSTYKNILAQQYLTFGITTIIDMGQKDQWVEETIKWQKNPSPDFPNLYINGSSIISDEKRRPAPHHLEVMNPEAAKKKVQEYASKGLKYMKLYSRLRAPEMKAIISEAKKHGLLLNAHVDNNVVTIPEAMDYGVRNFEHFFTLSPSVLAYNEHWVLMDEKYKLKGIRSIDDFTAAMSFFFDYIKEDPALTTKLNQLFDRMSKEKASLSTAMHVLGSTAGKTSFFSSFNHFPIRQVPELNQFTALQKKQLERAFEIMMEFAKTAHDKGVRLRIGTDCEYGGEALLSELLLFAEAGFPIEDILQIATWNGYEAMNLTRDYGTIEKGKKADLVLFEQNPFEDYLNFLAPKTVVKGGKLFSPNPSAAFTFLDIVLKENFHQGKKWLKNHKIKTKIDPNPHEMKMVAYHLAASRKEDEAVAVLELNKKLFPATPNLIDEVLLNDLGYHYLFTENTQQAIEIFKWNVELFPESWNVYDSLGEAYHTNNNIDLAIANYKKSIALNPENTHGKKILEELKELHATQK